MFKKIFSRAGINIFFSSYPWLGSRAKICKKVLNIPPAGQYFKLDSLAETVSLDLEDWVRSGQNIFRLSKKQNYQLILKTCAKLYRLGRDFLNYTKKLSKLDFSKINSRELLKIYDEFSEKALNFGPSISFAQTIGPRLEEELKRVIKKRFLGLSQSVKDDILMSLAYPDKDNVHLVEEEALLKIGRYIQERRIKNWIKNKKVNQLIHEHLEEYGWIKARLWQGEPWQPRDVRARLKNELKRSCLKELIKKRESIAHQRKEAGEIMKKGGFRLEEKALVGAAKENVYLKTFRTDTYHQAGVLARPLFYAIAKKLGIKYEEMLNFTYPEIRKFLRGQTIDRKEMARRKKGCTYLVTPTYDKVIMVKKPAVKQLKESKMRILKGQIASLGKYQGPAKIIQNQKQFSKIKQGNVLIASMTTPDYMPILKKVKAIVTDEGGITCHAAIVSRELGIPCVIGTKIATKVLKDGDLVEVDATRGIVRKL